ncbi:MAP/microtubule affinity-regulating kinase 4 [Paraphaeosphaeria sporulosa]|uniref:Serine/threonine-protein kinase ATG1 n=1 Tax=Paraphaeosphaeria sporulosa TaxID=1460663 RepID=A0A177BYS7_9PLEO|nr:MAP/microtubule affinity-regulating kinase 4 [Paraphaeosphaeria sporulosa]OAG00306.1 MAP/microtubule affinity-regulating kinase 4 [Paraphaeosphaeria sporulosa]
MAAPSNNQLRSRRPAPASQASSSSASEMIGNFKRLEHIGKGSFAEVYRGIHVEKRQSVAIKSVNMSKLNKKLKDNLASEISILRSLLHPHVVALIDCHETPSRMHIIMEFCELGDLSSFIKKRADLVNHPSTQRMIEKYPNPDVGGLNEVIVRHFAKQTASALEFLRSKNYIHRDLKPQNLLLNPSSMFYSQSGILDRMPLAASANSLIPAAGVESLPMLKIADFGFARILPNTSLAETLCGSPLYMAPEILRYEKYDAKADLWSVGTVLFEMMCARPPFRANNHVELLKKIEDRKDQIRFSEGLVASRAMKNLIRALLKRHPLERMSYESFFSDPVIREEIPGLVDEDLPQSASQSIAPEPIAEPKRAPKTPVEMERRASESPYSQSPRGTNYGTTPPPRPSSRPSSGQFTAAPLRPSSSARRMSNTPQSPVEQHPSQREQRRPSLTNAATAPGRTATLHDQVVDPSYAGSRRRVSREEVLPPPSGLKEHLERERMPQRPEVAMREAAERAAQDTAIDEGFVFVEKRRVEIDALADEIAASPQTARDRNITRETLMKRRATTQGSPTSTTGATVPSRAIQIQQKQTAVHQRTGSYERRYRPSFESATSALSKAMNMVNIRGLGLSPPMMKGASPPQGYAGFPVYPTAQSSLLLVGESGKIADKSEDAAIIKQIEQLAQLSHVVYGFAEVKYKQLVPVAPSDKGLGIGARGVRRANNDELEDDEDDDLTPDTILVISEEALVLYVKALGMLNKAMDITASYWNRNGRGPASEGSNRAATNTERFQDVVKWLRDRFNECCIKSEIVARKLKQAQILLPSDHPSHPANRSTASGSATTVGSADNILLTTGVTAEKLMYDRALEMSRTAAVNELVGVDLPGCDLNYWTAILMLEAILEDEDESSSQKLGSEELDGLENDDRQAIQKLLEGMKARHAALKKKLQLQKAQKRASITSAPTPHSATRSSPSSQGAVR